MKPYERSKPEKFIYKTSSKFKSTIYANILASSASLYIGLDLIITNWIHSYSQHTVFKLFVTLQMLIRIVQTVYTHRPSENDKISNKTTSQNPENPENPEKPTHDEIYTEKISSTHGDVIKKVSSRHRYCPICQISVLDKDHHCWFLSTCISRSLNHADFFFFLTWLSAALLYTIVVHLRVSAVQVYQEAGLLVMFLPGGLFYLALGWIKLSSFLKMVRIYGMTGCFLFSVFVQLQYYSEHLKGRQIFALFQQSGLQFFKILVIPTAQPVPNVRKNV